MKASDDVAIATSISHKRRPVYITLSSLTLPLQGLSCSLSWSSCTQLCGHMMSTTVTLILAEASLAKPTMANLFIAVVSKAQAPAADIAHSRASQHSYDLCCAATVIRDG